MDESPTRYLLPPEEPVETKKRKKSKKSKGKTQEFDPDAFLETMSKSTQEPATQCPMCVIHPEEFLERRQADTCNTPIVRTACRLVFVPKILQGESHTWDTE